MTTEAALRSATHCYVLEEWSPVCFVALSLQLGASPNGASSVTELKKIQCTVDTFQRAKPVVKATLSNGQLRTVTGQSSFASSDDAALGVEGSGGSTVFKGKAAGASSDGSSDGMGVATRRTPATVALGSAASPAGSCRRFPA